MDAEAMAGYYLPPQDALYTWQALHVQRFLNNPNPMKLLALETSTEACSAALYWDGTITERYEIAPQRHNQLILPMLESLLAEAGVRLHDMDALAFGRGPGSFTGVRIAAGVVQGLAFGADLPVLPVSTLAAMAQEYWGVYRRGEDGHAEAAGPEAVADAAAVECPEEVLGYGIGSGWQTYEPVLLERLGRRVAGILPGRFPRARWVAALGAAVFSQGGSVAAEAAQPVYLRDKVAKKKGGGY
jgi:tRNA threonylcarbamoyladenosine biosynthesis protein TsaB